RTLLEAGMRRADRKKVVDKIAAVLILEGYMQRKPYAD
ncbi:MAG TPA: Holliday junction resolvase RuvX, partial [Firmicutes bacterium]|nr:Holliday junction resolvase RuvX [Bacillota bacterium]